MTEKQLIKHAEKMVEAIELRFGAGTIEDGKVNLTNLQMWSWRIAGARQLILALQERLHSPGDKDYKVYNKAIVDLIMSSAINMDRFLTGECDIMYFDHQRDKKGKIISCKAAFVEKVTTYKAIE